MPTFNCPYCGSNFILHEGKNFFHAKVDLNIKGKNDEKLYIIIYHFICSNSECKESVVIFSIVDSADRTLKRYVYPEPRQDNFELSIPEPLARNYKEALAQVAIDPKASARLAHQCIQGMLRDFWNVTPGGGLHKELAQIKDKIDGDTLACLESIYFADNVGMCLDNGFEAKVDGNAAELMLRMVEMLGREWYLQRDQKRSRRAEIVALSQSPY